MTTVVACRRGRSQLSVDVVGTAPNARGELPPEALCFLFCASFPEGRKKAKVNTIHHKAYLLAGGRIFKLYLMQKCKTISPMTFVLWMPETDRIKFVVTPAVLMALFSGSLGS